MSIIIIEDPLWNNIACALLTVIYVKSMLELTSLIRDRLGCPADQTRKIIHIGAGCWILFWPLFDVTHWSWRLNIIVPAVMAIKLFYKGAILKDPNDADVRTMSRSSSPAELLYGPLQFTLFMMWVGTQQFMTCEGAILVAGLGVGDGLAPLVGRYYGNMKYKFPLQSSRKSIEGSFFGVFLGTIGGTWAFLHMLGLPMLSHESLVMIGIVTTVAEATSPENFDNVFIPLVLHFTLKHVPSLMTTTATVSGQNYVHRLVHDSVNANAISVDWSSETKTMIMEWIECSKACHNIAKEDGANLKLGGLYT